MCPRLLHGSRLRRVAKYGILSKNRRSKLHAVIDCLFLTLRYDTSESGCPVPTSAGHA